MKSSKFELRHQNLLHQLLVAAAFVSYLYDPEDIVWRFIKNTPSPHQFERALFIVATIAVFLGAVLCTWSRAHRKLKATASVDPSSEIDGPQALGEILYAIGLASLFPLSGFLILVVGETLRVVRLVSLKDDRQLDTHWLNAFRLEAVKWGILIAMIIFVITLRDRVAEYLAGASFLVGLLVNAPAFNRSRGRLVP